MKIKKKSNWVYDTSSGGDLGILIVSNPKGDFKIKEHERPPNSDAVLWRRRRQSRSKPSNRCDIFKMSDPFSTGTEIAGTTSVWGSGIAP